MSMERNKIIAACYLYILSGDKILLMHRRNTGYHDGDYGLVSGHVEAGETPRQAIIREAKEEAGIDVDPDDLELVHVLGHKSHVDASERIDFFWRCAVWSGNVCNNEPEKCDELSWYSLNSLPANLVPELRGVMECIGRGQIYSELGYD